MMKKKLIATLFGLPCVMAWASSEVTSDWGYQAQTAPQYWSQLNSKYQTCAGHNQSPINIEHVISADLAPLDFDYKTAATSIVKLPHTLQANFHQGSYLSLEGERFQLLQMHLHSPSENTVHGKSFPMELHLVHASEKGELAVIAMMYEQGKKNQALDGLWQQYRQPQKVFNLNADQFLPTHREYYRFNGSLTTPPCTEGVRWVVLKDIQQASAQQITNFAALMGYPNNRPVQATNARLVLD